MGIGGGYRGRVINEQKLVAHAKDEEKRLRLDQVVKGLKAILREHLESAGQGRINYRLRRSKALRNRDKLDISMINYFLDLRHQGRESLQGTRC